SMPSRASVSKSHEKRTNSTATARERAPAPWRSRYCFVDSRDRRTHEGRGGYFTSTSKATLSVWGSQLSAVHTANLSSPVKDFLPLVAAVKATSNSAEALSSLAASLAVCFSARSVTPSGALMVSRVG